jgi:YfiH family protein
MEQNRSRSLYIQRENDLVYVTFPSFNETKLVNHCFSTKLGGVSTGIFESLNLGFNRGDSDENVRKNYEILCKAIGINVRDLVFSDQIHKANICMITEKDKGKGIIKKSDIKGIDGLITNVPKVPLITFYADCVPLFFLDPIQKVVGLAHAGWRGTVKNIAGKMIQRLKNDYKCNPQDILIAIGPSIGACCFEVDDPVANEFKNVFDYTDSIVFPQQNGKFYIDLWEANRQNLLNAGVQMKHITVTDLCTKCNKDIFFSHRGHQGKRGNLAAIIELL